MAVPRVEGGIGHRAGFRLQGRRHLSIGVGHGCDLHGSDKLCGWRGLRGRFRKGGEWCVISNFLDRAEIGEVENLRRTARDRRDVAIIGGKILFHRQRATAAGDGIGNRLTAGGSQTFKVFAVGGRREGGRPGLRHRVPRAGAWRGGTAAQAARQ